VMTDVTEVLGDVAGDRARRKPPAWRSWPEEALAALRKMHEMKHDPRSAYHGLSIREACEALRKGWYVDASEDKIRCWCRDNLRDGRWSCAE